jgi:hypothetical protein
VCVVLFEVSGIPLLHGDHRMVGCGQACFGANGVDPFIDSLFAIKAQLIKILYS